MKNLLVPFGILLATVFMALALSCSNPQSTVHQTTVVGPSQPDSRMRGPYPVKDTMEKPVGAQYTGGSCSHCGTERWDVKTLTDSGASQIDKTEMPTDVSVLTAISPPSNPTSRVCPTECNTYKIDAYLVGFKMEGDQDYHLVIADMNNPSTTMIAEIPSSVCDTVCKSGKGSLYDSMRTTLDTKFGHPRGTRFNRLSSPAPITITGVGFFDRLHGQTGVAPNGIELHPVLKLEFH